MDDKRLRALLTAVQCGSFGKATAQLGYTQSAMTHMVNKLEAELGCTLLTRSSHGVRLSEEGEHLLPYIQDYLRASETLRREAAAQGEAHNRVLRIGCFASIARARLPALLQKFRKLHPEIKIDVLVGGYELAAALEEERVQLALVEETCGKGFYWTPLTDAPLVAVVPPDFPWAEDVIPLERLLQETFLSCPEQYVARLLPPEAPRLEVTASDDAAILSMVAAGLGVALALVIALALFLWPVQIMDLMSNKHHLSLLGAPYLRVIGFSYVFNMLSSIYVSAMRSAENPGFGMKLFGVSTLLNTGMNYLLIFGKCGLPALGIQGAAIATLLSRVAEFLICLVCALRSRILPLDLAAFFRPGWEMLRRFVKYASPVMANELFWGLGNSLLTVILGHMTISVEFLAANAVMGNLNRLFLVVCFGLGAATAVMIGKAIGEGQSHDELMDLSRTLSWVTILVGAALAVIALALVPLLFQPVVFPLFKLYDLSAHLATTLAVTGFACIPFHAYSISAVTGILRAGGDVFWSTALDLAPQWLVALPLTALLALVLDADPWFVSLAIQAESFIKCPICLWRIRSRKWIHDVTLPEGER